MNDIVIREETTLDHEGIRLMHQIAFGSTAVATLTDNLRDSRDTVISLVAMSGHKVVGHIMLSRLKAPMKALTLAPLAVHPDFQRRGIGADLVRKGLDRARQDGWTAIFVLGDTGYYERLGFSLSRAKGYSSPYSGDHFMILSFDPENTPPTGDIVYPTPFEALN